MWRPRRSPDRIGGLRPRSRQSCRSDWGAFLHIFSIERFRITCTHPGCPRIEYAREITEAEDARIIAEIKDKIDIRELTPEGRAAFIEKSKPIYKEFESRVTPELIQKAMKAAAGN